MHSHILHSHLHPLMSQQQHHTDIVSLLQLAYQTEKKFHHWLEVRHHHRHHLKFQIHFKLLLIKLFKFICNLSEKLANYYLELYDKFSNIYDKYDFCLARDQEHTKFLGQYGQVLDK